MGAQVKGLIPQAVAIRQQQELLRIYGSQIDFRLFGQGIVDGHGEPEGFFEQINLRQPIGAGIGGDQRSVDAPISQGGQEVACQILHQHQRGVGQVCGGARQHEGHEIGGEGGDHP